MPRFLNTTGRSTLAIGVCDRCNVKMSLDELHPDTDSRGLRVCKDCDDEFDPYKLPARRTENITVRHPRPDEPLVVPADD